MDSIIGISGGDEKLKFEWDEEKNLINSTFPADIFE